jgi:Lon protease-like protein
MTRRIRSRPGRIPLLPLSDHVHFPRTRLGLDVHDPRHEELVAALADRDEADRWLGTVLVDPAAGTDERGRRAVFQGGTAGRVVRVEQLPDGRWRLALVGESRFRITREIAERPFREAWIELVAEPELREDDAGIVAVRRELLALVGLLRVQDGLGEECELDAGDLLALGLDASFEELVNRVAAEIDLPALRKLGLLVRSLPDRALELIDVLRARRRLIDALRPYRRPGTDASLN